MLEPQVLPADAAAVFVGEQDLFTERRIATTRGRVAATGICVHLRRIPIETVSHSRRAPDEGAKGEACRIGETLREGWRYFARHLRCGW